jgi:hypothetical protein
LYLVATIATCLPKHANAQFGARDDETPQRMCVGLIKEGVLDGFERTRATNRLSEDEYNALSWYCGDLGSGNITKSDSQTSVIEGQTSSMLRRWYWEEGRLWVAFEASYGPFGGSSPGLWRTKSVATIHREDIDGATVVATQPDQKVWIEAFGPGIRRFGASDELEQLSFLERMMKGMVDPVHPKWSTPGETGGLFCHRNGGFDFIPHALDHWTLFMTVGHTMQIWDCRSKRVATEEGEEIRNTWTLVTELWVPWSGQFFAFERYFHYEYVFVRDCGEVYLLRLEKDMHTARPKLRQGTVWRGRQLLDPVDYLIALIYIEPENTVYGFGPNFYVRLATSERPWPPESPPSSHTKKSCRDVTKGKAIWTDEKGQTHELGEPYRTIWQCANVLKEEGVLEAATETETKPEGREAATATTR